MGGILMPYMTIAGQQGVITPSQIPSLNLWYDASEAISANFNPVPTNAGAVSSWLDKQGLGRAADQPSGIRQPTWNSNQQNSQGAILFDGSNDVLTLNNISWSLSLPGQTSYVVVKANALTGTPRITQTNTNGYQFFWDSTWGVETAGGRAKSATAGNTTNYIYMGMILDGTQTNPDVTVQNNLRLKMRINGAPQTLTFSTNVGTATSGAANTMFVGAASATGTNPFSGYIGEMLIWTRTLNTSEILAVETYLSDKWGI